MLRLHAVGKKLPRGGFAVFFGDAWRLPAQWIRVAGLKTSLICFRQCRIIGCKRGADGSWKKITANGVAARGNAL